jgi:hypothetical protein
MRTQLFGAVGAFALAASTLVAPAGSNAEDDHDCAGDPTSCVFCGPPTYWNSGLNQCVMAGPGFEPVGPVGVGPNPVVGEAGPVGFGGVGQ